MYARIEHSHENVVTVTMTWRQLGAVSPAVLAAFGAFMQVAADEEKAIREAPHVA